jgi:hypothetical protein
MTVKVRIIHQIMAPCPVIPDVALDRFGLP